MIVQTLMSLPCDDGREKPPVGKFRFADDSASEGVGWDGNKVLSFTLV